MQEAVDRGEMESLSVDTTLRCCLRILGQASYRASAASRAQAAFDDSASKRRALTVRGRTSAVLGIFMLSDEDTASYVDALRSGFSLCPQLSALGPRVFS